MSKPKIGDVVWWGDDRSSAYEITDKDGQTATIYELTEGTSIPHLVDVSELTSVTDKELAELFGDDDDFEVIDDWEDDDDD